MKPIKLFDTQNAMESYINQAEVQEPQIFLYSEKATDSVVCDKKMPLPTLYLFGDRNDLGELDEQQWFKYVGTWTSGSGDTYYKWRGEGCNLCPFYLLTDTLDFSETSIENPYIPVGYISIDGQDTSYHWENGKIYECRNTIPQIIQPQVISGLDKNGQEYVDLGLPSHILWAKYNVGASSSNLLGNYFQWGDTQGYPDASTKTFNWANYKYCNGNYNTLTKYNTNSSYGTVDNKTLLEAMDDGVKNVMGGDWSIPRKEAIQDLLINTSKVWVENYQGSGFNGIEFTGPNKNTLFIPAAGYANGSSVYGVGGYCSLWSSSLNSDSPGYAWYLYFGSDGVSVRSDDRYFGFSLRGVLQNFT